MARTRPTSSRIICKGGLSGYPVASPHRARISLTANNASPRRPANGPSDIRSTQIRTTHQASWPEMLVPSIFAQRAAFSLRQVSFPISSSRYPQTPHLVCAGGSARRLFLPVTACYLHRISEILREKKAAYLTYPAESQSQESYCGDAEILNSGKMRGLLRQC